MHEIINEVIKP